MSSNPKTLLIVEDDEDLASVYQARLEAEGFVVKHASNGQQALGLVAQAVPDLMLLDVMMPGMSGFEVLESLRARPETAKLKIIMLSALGQDSDREQAQRLGADDYLVKAQVVIADVVQRIKYHLGI